MANKTIKVHNAIIAKINNKQLPKQKLYGKCPSLSWSSKKGFRCARLNKQLKDYIYIRKNEIGHIRICNE